MPESINTERDENVDNNTPIFGRIKRAWQKHGGVVGITKDVVSGKAGKGVVDTVLYGRPRDKDPAPPKKTFRRSEFVHDTITNKDGVVDERRFSWLHNRRRDYKERKPLEVKVDEVYPLMREFWITHVEKLRVLFHDHSDLLNDKSSYLYAQYLIARSITVDAGPRGLGQVDMAKLNTYFQTAEGYNETMRYMEEELMRLEQANNVVTLLKNGYKPDGTDLVDMGVVGLRDVAQAISTFGAGAFSSVTAAIWVGRVLSSLSTIAPTIGPGLATIAPWIPAVLLGGVGLKLTSDKIKHIMNIGKSRDIMQDCNNLFLAMSTSPEFSAERAYLRGVYAIDPADLKFPQSQGQQHAVFAQEGITTSGWAGSKKIIHDIRETRRLFYEKICGIKERERYGVPEEAFFDINGNYRTQVLPEGRAIIYEQEVWDRFNELGRYTTIDQTSQQERPVTQVEAIQRFQQARREVIFSRIQDRAEAIIAEDRKTGFVEAAAIITQKKKDIGTDGEVRKQEKKTISDETALLQRLDGGAENKPGLKAYADGWKSGEGSPEARLSKIEKLRQEIFDKVTIHVAFIEPMHEIGIAKIDEAINKLKNEIGDDSKGLTKEKNALVKERDAIPKKTKVRTEKNSRGVERDVFEDNPDYKIKSDEVQAKDDEIKKFKEQIAELESLKTRLQSELARYNVSGEHGKAFAENVRKMESAYMRLVSSAADRGGKGKGLTETDVTAILQTYPDGTFSIKDPVTKRSVLRSGTVAELMKTLANEAVPPLWKEALNDSFDNQMTILYAVAYAKAKARIDSLGQGGKVGDRAYIAGGKKIHEVFISGLTDGKFNEMTILARNEAELKEMGAVSGVDMSTGDNVALSTYARTRLGIYVDTLQELMEKHRRDVETLTKKGTEIDEKYEAAEKQYAVVEELITREQGTEPTKKISSQVQRRGLTGDKSIRILTDTKTFAQRSNEEQERYHDYEKRFLEGHPSFPPAMLEFLDVVFQFRSDPAGAEKLKSIYEVLRQLGHTGATKLEPHIVLADMIYNSHPSIRNMIRITRDQGIKGYEVKDQTGKVIDTLTWDTIVLLGFQLRHTGFQHSTGHPVYVSSVKHPYSTMEMNTIFTSIHDQIIDKVAKNGVTIV